MNIPILPVLSMGFRLTGSLALLWTTQHAAAQVISCGSDNYSVCYHDNMDSVVTYQCPLSGIPVMLLFCEGETEMNVDRVTVYDGIDTLAPILFVGMGPAPGPWGGILAINTNPDNALTVRIRSNGSTSCQTMGYIPVHYSVGCTPVCLPLGMGEPNEPEVLLHPNPASGQVTLQLPGSSAARIQVINALGGTVLERNAVGADRAMLSIGDLAPGPYRVLIRTARGSWVLPMVKE